MQFMIVERKVCVDGFKYVVGYSLGDRNWNDIAFCRSLVEAITLLEALETGSDVKGVDAFMKRLINDAEKLETYATIYKECGQIVHTRRVL